MMQEIPVYTYSSFKTFFMWNRDVFLSARNIPNGINIKIFSMTYAFSCVDAPHVENNCRSTPTLDPGSLEKNVTILISNIYAIILYHHMVLQTVNFLFFCNRIPIGTIPTAAPIKQAGT